MPSHRSIMITAICIAIGLAVIELTNFTWGWFFISYALVGGFVIGFMFYLRVVAAAQMQDTVARAYSELIMDEEGILAGEAV